MHWPSQERSGEAAVEVLVRHGSHALQHELHAETMSPIRRARLDDDLGPESLGVPITTRLPSFP